MKNLSETSYVIGIKIHRDRSEKTLSLSQKPMLKQLWEKLGYKAIHLQVLKL